MNGSKRRYNFINELSRSDQRMNEVIRMHFWSNPAAACCCGSARRNVSD
ncbi:hypothetical protein I5677_16730 [Mobilitalea sibirica]|uniref:Uncharacterized protein n=1 Tax=Mobilitalea sibirica TaxID=1462919 RepID=A0A8J7H6J4_9FIRM|nr:hypothetical protein [Mobilitalea sibirica]MBH1942539.1 hypothetical protein [Mobilitalea sibirica]